MLFTSLLGGIMDLENIIHPKVFLSFQFSSASNLFQLWKGHDHLPTAKAGNVEVILESPFSLILHHQVLFYFSASRLYFESVCSNLFPFLPPDFKPCLCSITWWQWPTPLVSLLPLMPCSRPATAATKSDLKVESRWSHSTLPLPHPKATCKHISVLHIMKESQNPHHALCPECPAFLPLQLHFLPLSSLLSPSPQLLFEP